MKKYLSYSEMSLFHWDRDKYIRQYVEGIYDEEMPDRVHIGTIIHNTIEDHRYPYLEEFKKLGLKTKEILILRNLLTKMYRKKPAESEVKLMARTKEGIDLFVKIDGLNRQNRELDEFKTSDKDDAWTPWKVDYNEQISFYSYVYYILFHQYLKEIRLTWGDTRNANCKTFYTARGKRDHDYIAKKIRETVKEMKSLGIWEKRMSSQDKINKNITPMNI